MPKSCLDGYLTEGCKACEFWEDGSDPKKGVGCCCPFPIMHCDSFREMYENDPRNKLDEE